MGRVITVRWLSAKLRTFDIKPATVNLGEKVNPKGYCEHQFNDAFDRYISRRSLADITKGE